uniref:Uncharacterized protein n=1 Tax=Glossina pallidipes TaxID=7398 RepID=A0A1A9ZJB0_GLOPL
MLSKEMVTCLSATIRNMKTISSSRYRHHAAMKAIHHSNVGITYAADVSSEQEVLNGRIYSFSRAAFQLRVISIQKLKVVVIPNHEEVMVWKMEPRGFINKSFR